MNDIIILMMVIATLACMLLAQRKTTPSHARRAYSLLGSLAALSVALHAASDHQFGIAILFIGAAIASLIGIFIDFKPKTDA